MEDKYVRIILGVIAVALLIIAVKPAKITVIGNDNSDMTIG